jgi:hypothetical protein
MRTVLFKVDSGIGVRLIPIKCVFAHTLQTCTDAQPVICLRVKSFCDGTQQKTVTVSLMAAYYDLWEKRLSALSDIFFFHIGQLEK